jgi:hypothetical protein
MARSAEALRSERNFKADDCWLDDDWKKNQNQVVGKMGFKQNDLRAYKTTLKMQDSHNDSLWLMKKAIDTQICAGRAHRVAILRICHERPTTSNCG